MKFNSKYDIGDTVYIKSGTGVSKGKVCAIGLDMSKDQLDGFTFIYLVWESDRKDNAGHHVKVYEGNLGRTFDEAYYDAFKKFPWDISEDLMQKDVENFFKRHSETGGSRD